MQEIEVARSFRAPLQRVFERYTDHVSWTEWAGLGRVRLRAQGTPPPNGVGCVRVFANLGLDVVAEEVVAFEAPRRMAYRVIGATPLRNHLGEVTFAPSGEGTVITWRCRFDSAVPGLGPLLRAGIWLIFRRVLSRLARDLRA